MMKQKFITKFTTNQKLVLRVSSLAFVAYTILSALITQDLVTSMAVSMTYPVDLVLQVAIIGTVFVVVTGLFLGPNKEDNAQAYWMYSMLSFIVAVLVAFIPSTAISGSMEELAMNTFTVLPWLFGLAWTSSMWYLSYRINDHEPPTTVV